MENGNIEGKLVMLALVTGVKLKRLLRRQVNYSLRQSTAVF